MQVVKLGGSLARWDRLPACLAHLVPLGLIIVPGGGPFADQVRAMQRHWRFDDGTAHIMAIQAMCQFGMMLIGLEHRLRPGTTPAELRRQAEAGRTSVWLPRSENLEGTFIPASWSVTSDSLAAWLAARLGASDLILLKSARCPPDEVTLEQLAASDIVDPAFGRFAGGASFTTWLCHRDDYRALAAVPPADRSRCPMRRVHGPVSAGGG